MKKIKFLLFVVFIAGMFGSFEAMSQAEVVFGNTVTFKDGYDRVYECIDSKTTLSPSGNIVKTATFELPENHYLIAEKWTTYIMGRIKETNVFGEEVYMYDLKIAIHRNGRFKVVYHLNQSGRIFPARYKDVVFPE